MQLYSMQYSNIYSMVCIYQQICERQVWKMDSSNLRLGFEENR